ncbi:hypothetical protein CEXT_363691 [Caerostris extrusa]|uniref:G-protein coupled receptors family 1 profile domain-containing protein n=1 Tax=Caerostris extrusa TaxID=172846 RepID=A0AAV4XGX9_CAEEX|nr:hypothetical protein CEXT_363691 [Caerostris extrusa]
MTHQYGKCPCHRRGDIAHITRDRDRAFRMMISTTLTFVLFLIPYAATVVWCLSQPVSAENVESSMESFFLAFSVSSSCINPFIYGSHVYVFRKRAIKVGCGSTAPKAAPANRFSETSHLRVSATITRPVSSRDDDGESMVHVWKCHCSASCNEIEGMQISCTSENADSVAHSLYH